MPACRECKKKENASVRERVVLSVTRYAGGSYKMPPRHYSTSLCVGCAEEMLALRAETAAEGRGVGRLVGEGFVVSSVEYALKKFKEANP